MDNSRFWYIKSRVSDLAGNGGSGNNCVLEKPHEAQIWPPVPGLCVTGLLREDGQDTPLKFPGNYLHCPCQGGVHDPACRFLQSLPTGPHALLGLIERDMQGQPPRPEETFTTIGDLLGAAIAPPQVSAALYRTAALIPGVTVVPDAIDAIGRQALRPPAPSGASAPSGSSPKKTFRYLGARDANVATGSPAGVSAVPRRASAGHAGQIPG